MEKIIKKLEEQITFLQHEISQMNDELYSQQKEIIQLKNEITDVKKRIDVLDFENELDIVKENKKPPHY